MNGFVTFLAILVACAAGVATGFWLSISSQCLATKNDMLKLEKNIMAAFEDIKRELGVINGTTNEIAADIDELIAKLSQTGGVTEAQAQEIVTDLQGLSTTLKGVASKYPVQPPPPPA